MKTKIHVGIAHIVFFLVGSPTLSSVCDEPNTCAYESEIHFLAL